MAQLLRSSLPIEYRALSNSTRLEGFSCGDSEIDKWLRNKALKHHDQRKHLVTCASFDDAPDEVAGFYALSAVTEDARKLPGVTFFSVGNRYFPCVQLVYMAMRKSLQRQEHGTEVLAHAVRVFSEIGQLIGIPAMILTPINGDARRFYERVGFQSYGRESRMFLPLETAIKTIQEAEAEVSADEG